MGSRKEAEEEQQERQKENQVLVISWKPKRTVSRAGTGPNASDN